MSDCIFTQLECCLLLRYECKHTNLGRLMEKHGSSLLGTLYKDPITSFSLFQKFSAQNPEVNIYLNFRVSMHFVIGRIELIILTWLLGLLVNCSKRAFG